MTIDTKLPFDQAYVRSFSEKAADETASTERGCRQRTQGEWKRLPQSQGAAPLSVRASCRRRGSKRRTAYRLGKRCRKSTKSVQSA